MMFLASLSLFLAREYTFFHQQDVASRQLFAGRRQFKQLDTGNAEMAEGTIKKLTDRGFGFIKTSGEKDLFFHSSSVQGVSFDDLHEGQKVSYTEGKGPKGPCAENVKPV
jgi:CspA family cold shock protein